MESRPLTARRGTLAKLAAVVVVLVLLTATLLIYYSPDYSWAASIRDHDGDGYADNDDAFPDDPLEWCDSDCDGCGDRSDVFPMDPTNTTGFSCGFEGEFIPPFFFLYGTIHDHNNLRIHDGDYSFALQSDLEIIGYDCCGLFDNTNPLNQTGRISVFIYDPGPTSRDNATVEVDDLWGNHLMLGLFGPSSSYCYRINGDYFSSGVSRATGWHKFEMVIGDLKSTAYIDGTKILETPELTSMHMLWLGDWWGDGIVSDSAAFDDVSITKQ